MTGNLLRRVAASTKDFPELPKGGRIKTESFAVHEMGKDWPTVAQWVDRWEDCLRRGGWSVSRYILSYGVHRAQGVYADWPRLTELQVLAMARAILARATFAEEHILDDLLWEWMDDQDQDSAREMELPSGTIAEWIARGKPIPSDPKEARNGPSERR